MTHIDLCFKPGSLYVTKHNFYLCSTKTPNSFLINEHLFVRRDDLIMFLYSNIDDNFGISNNRLYFLYKTQIVSEIIANVPAFKEMYLLDI